MLGLYIHIPFCEYLCHYCDFVKQVPKNDEMIDKYIDHLLIELNDYREYFPRIETIYIGGGTPSMLSPNQLDRILKSLRSIQASEFTIEVNPESYTHEKGIVFYTNGVNRISLGVQSFNDEVLRYVNRHHKEKDIYNVVADLKSIGIDNVSIDLIYAIPGQSIEILKSDLDKAIALDIDHISCYSLILEEKTFFYHQYIKGKFNPIENELEAQMFELVIDELTKNGFEQYEISNFARNNKYSVHNKIYWTLNEYIGIGLGAHGFINNERTYNHKSLNKYYEGYQATRVKQNISDNLTDELVFGLRLISGISIKYIEQKYDIKLLDKYPELKDKISLGLVEISNGYLRLTNKGIFFGNQVFEVFV
ncbi:MAG: radical SAM family heme chaperone HemW [Acholeplasma sp.]|nr:radical SAM family heme chaperone HemW [Acholeplasma sp.]